MVNEINSATYDVIVIGGGHAGIEAALAAARMGARCALVTHDIGEIGRMPCNPAIGGLGKGHLVREIDVLGGEMGLAIDQSGIQFRVLNMKKGPAVQSPRAQADKHRYQQRMMQAVLDQPGLDSIAGDVHGLLVEPDSSVPGGRRTTGVLLDSGHEVFGARVVLCTGTFLKGLMHVGDDRKIGGREGASSSEGLSGALLSNGFQLKRLKTGTPPRLLGSTIEYSQLRPQPGDHDPAPFSMRTRNFGPDQIECHMAYTNERTHDIIRNSLTRSPLFTGMIEGQGPRYCPSIEDKVVRFADKDRHLLFLEPEGLDTDEVYVNGLSTSLPGDVQQQVVASVPGLENAKLLRFGYAVEYDSIPSWQTGSDLQSKPVAGLYLAGQILGTSGYEEAAGQGLIAGVNAVRNLDGKAPVVLGRDEAYLGVMVDDLVTKEINEPYRMFTSRAEHRLQLRCDNAPDRLTNLALELGLLKAADQEALRARRQFIASFRDLLRKTRAQTNGKNGRMSAEDCLRLTGVGLVNLADMADGPEDLKYSISLLENELMKKTPETWVLREARSQVENDIKYDGYIAKHRKQLRSQEHLDHLELPAALDYKNLTALSFEAREKLDRIRPATLGQAARIDGVRAGDLAVLTVFMKKLKDRQDRDSARGDHPEGRT